MSWNNILPLWVIMMPEEPEAKRKYLLKNEFCVPEHVRQDLLKKLEKQDDTPTTVS